MSARLECDCGFHHQDYSDDYYSEDEYYYSENISDYDDNDDDHFDYKDEDPTPRCAQCHKTANQTRDLVLRICTQCKTAHYCTRKCQKTHWVHHKEFCDSVCKVTELLQGAEYPPGLHDDLQENLQRFKFECKSWPVVKTGPGKPPGPKPPSTAKTLYMRSMGDKPPKPSRLPTTATSTKATTPVKPAAAATKPTTAAVKPATASINPATYAIKPATPAAKVASTTTTPAKPATAIATKVTIPTANAAPAAAPTKAGTPTKPATPTTPVKTSTLAANSTPAGPTPPTSKDNITFSKPTIKPFTIGRNTGAPLTTNSTLSPFFSKEPGQEVISKGLIKHIDKPYHHLYAKTWLHNRPEEDVFKLLIDCFRMRQHDNFTVEGIKDKDSVYAGASHSQAGFKRFLVLAESRTELLPNWWFMGKAAANCLRLGGGLGSDGTKWSLLSCKVNKAMIIDHYANPEMPMQLRMLAEQVYGRGVAGESCAEMLKMKIDGDGWFDMTFDMTRAGFKQ
ncbi:hypothetical protein BGZ95_001522 [Linnemannia exigua]|uniref:MYND-type domain-containing protein n=1 Tax=Linnemannia exigua TaxID=604196 RepID=A0AAD4H3P2_9FUNG|nr:hypothetical protein BGZ95_001522 [Linnemannia exigua]